MTIQEKLSLIQAELKAPKNQHNDFGNFNYRSCEDILEALKPLLQKSKTFLTISDEIVNIGSRFYIRATAALCDAESESHISVYGYAREPENRPKMDEAQVTGSSSSYARKYALNGLFCIDDAKDPDATNTGQNKVSPAQQKGQQVNLSQAEFHKLQKEADKKGVSYSSIYQRYGKKSLYELSKEDYRRAMSGLSKMPDKVPEDYTGYEIDPSEMPFR